MTDKAAEQNNWELWRLDEHGQKFLMTDQLNKEDAESLVREYERRGHKQHYWAQQRESHH